MTTLSNNHTSSEWKGYEKILFRFFFIFLILLTIPLDWKFYQLLFSINWLDLHWHNLFELSKYHPQFFNEGVNSPWGLGSYSSWGFLILIGIVGTGVWSVFDKERKEYAVLYYWLRVLLRYRLAFALITYGFIKVFPLQMPYPPLSNLLTHYGDFFHWKIYFQTLGIAPKYQSFLGFVEIFAAILILNRRTVTFGVGILFGFMGNIAVVNGFYDVGEHVFSTYLVLISVFLFAHDIPRLWSLLVKETYTLSERFKPDFSNQTIKKLRFGLRTVFVLFIVLFGFKTYSNFSNDPYKLPKTPGLKDAYGLYNVKVFVLNKDTIPYSRTDERRWQDVVFEKWSTLSVKQNRPVKIDFTTGENANTHDIDRNYESAGVAGRHYFYYEADTLNNTLKLQNKNKNHRDEHLLLQFARPNDSTIVLKGINENQDSIYAELHRVNKKFFMLEGRRKPVKL
jgi:hypothetical protein